jgi:hypothetical protein
MNFNVGRVDRGKFFELRLNELFQSGSSRRTELPHVTFVTHSISSFPKERFPLIL